MVPEDTERRGPVLDSLVGFVREVHREVQTTVGRRCSRSNATPARVAPPAGTKGLIIQESDGWDVIERVESTGKQGEGRSRVLAEAPLPEGEPYIISGEAGATDEEDAEYRRIWNLPPKLPSGAGRAAASSSHECQRASPSAAPSRPSRPSAPSPPSPTLPPSRPLPLPSTCAAPARAAPPARTPPETVARPSAAAASSRSLGPTPPASGPTPPASGLTPPASGPTPPASGLTPHASGPMPAATGLTPPASGLTPPASGPTPAASGLTPPASGLTPPAAVPAPPAAEAHDRLTHRTHRAAAAAHAPAGLVREGSTPAQARGAAGRSTLQRCGHLASVAAQIGSHVALGLFQAHRPALSCRHIFSVPHSRKCVFDCLVLDVVLFRGALFVYEVGVPSLCRGCFGIELQGDGRYELAILLLWTVPAYLVCEIVSTSWHYKMAQRMASPSSAVGEGEDGLLQAFTSIVYTRLVYVVFLVQVRLLSSLPLVGTAVTLLLSALLHAYDSFELCWGAQGLGVSQRFRLIEEHWSFFLGYGGLLALLSIGLRFWDLFVVRAVLYPVYIANAPHASFEQLRCRPLPVFQPALAIFNGVLQQATLYFK